MSRKKKTSLETSSTSDSSPGREGTSSPDVNNSAKPSSSLESSQNSKSVVTHESSPGILQNSQEFIEENLKGALLDWLKRQSFYQSRSLDEKNGQEKLMKDLADKLITVIDEAASTDNMDLVLLKEINKHIQNFSVDPKQKSNQQFLDDLSTQILGYLKSLQLFQDISLRHNQSSGNKSTNAKKKAAVIMLEDIANWIDNLPIDIVTPEEAENFKEQLESKLIHKIGELNMHSEIFNDDIIYDDILGEEIENLLTDIPSQNIKHNIIPLKRELLAIVKRARKKIREENEGLMYKQQLQDTISKILPSFDLSIEGKASFEVLKDNVADAFISMRYADNNTCEVAKLRKRINDEIYKFCNNYLKRCPASPIDTSKLNQALYEALKNVAEPQNESFKENVEVVRTKDVINDWAKDLPLKNQIGQEKLHTNKMVSVLATKINDIENEKDITSTEEYEDKTKKEIMKFLKKLTMTTDNDDDINELVEKLMKILKDTEESRKLNGSTNKHCNFLAKGPSKAKLRFSFNDTSISPCPVDTYSQTFNSNKCPGPFMNLIQKCSSVQTPCKRMQTIGSQINVTPNVVVNEYHWDSIDESCVQTPRTSCPCPTASSPPYVTMPQPIQSSLSSRGDESYMQARPPHSPCEFMPQPQRTRSPVSREGSEFTPLALKSCLITQPFPMEQFQNNFTKPHDQNQAYPCSCGQHQAQPTPPYSSSNYDYDDDDYQFAVSATSPPYRNETDRTQTEKQPCNQSFEAVLEENNSFEIGNQYPTTCQLPQTSSSNPLYPYQLSTTPAPARPESSSDYQRADLQNNQYQSQPCSCQTSHDTNRQRTLQDSQYIPCATCSRSPQMRIGIRQSNIPMTPSQYMTQPQYSQGQSNVTPRSSMSFSLPPQMPCVFNPRSPCYIKPESTVPASSCASRKSAARLGNFHDEEPQLHVPRYPEWRKVQDDFKYWETDRQPNFDPVIPNNRRDGKRCKVCKHRFDEYNRKRC